MAIDYSGIKRELNTLIGTARRLIEAIEGEERAAGDTAFDMAIREPATLGAAGVNADHTAASPSLAARAGAAETTASAKSGTKTGDDKK